MKTRLTNPEPFIIMLCSHTIAESSITSLTTKSEVEGARKRSHKGYQNDSGTRTKLMSTTLGNEPLLPQTKTLPRQVYTNNSSQQTPAIPYVHG